VPQRTVADGSSLVELDEAYVERLTQELVANGVEAIAVSFLAQLHQSRGRTACA
jgi:N-methylhydantoinase A/oxoprolinase/acetone carboxylase beta subunit